MPTTMVIIPHADDAAAFCGGTIAKLADQGEHIVLVRVTDDAKDSVGLTIEQTIAQNAAELRQAAAILGVAHIEELGFPTDSLADVSKTQLRERLVYMIRKHRPYRVLGFDPYGRYEDNLDHVVVAQATDEAFWVSGFDLHHPEHFDEGLSPFVVCERWYFGRHLVDADHAEEVSPQWERRIAAFAAHRTMVRNIVQHYRLMLAAAGRRSPLLDDCFAGDPAPALALVLEETARTAATTFGLPDDARAELFRTVRFGGLAELLETISEPIEE